MSNEKEFFRSKSEIDVWSGDVDAFGPFYESAEDLRGDERIPFGFWMRTFVDGNPDISWHPMCSNIKYMMPPRLSGFESNTRFTLSEMPSHDGSVSLSTSDSFGNHWELPLITDPTNTGRAFVLKDSPGSGNSDHFESIMEAVRNYTPIFAWSKWGGSVYFPILVDTGGYRDVLWVKNSRRQKAAETGVPYKSD
eukprot:636972_1